jgi:hypothetical protein
MHWEANKVLKSLMWGAINVPPFVNLNDSLVTAAGRQTLPRVEHRTVDDTFDTPVIKYICVCMDDKTGHSDL